MDGRMDGWMDGWMGGGRAEVYGGCTEVVQRCTGVVQRCIVKRHRPRTNERSVRMRETSSNANKVVKYCELEAEKNAIRSRIEFCVEWRFSQLLTRNI